MIATPEQLQAEKKPADALTFWVIYKHPTDAPDAYVLRAQWVADHATIISEEAWYARTPEELHTLLPMWALTRVGPYTEDDPAIFEVWME